MINNKKRAWYILDEIAADCFGCSSAVITAKVIEAMKLLDKPTPAECQLLYNERNS